MSIGMILIITAIIILGVLPIIMGHSSPPPPVCKDNPCSSRTCEKGTKCCDIKHANEEAIKPQMPGDILGTGIPGGIDGDFNTPL